MTEPATLSPRQRAVLEAVCATLVRAVPEADDPEGFFAADHRGTDLLARVERLIAAIAEFLGHLGIQSVHASPVSLGTPKAVEP